MAPPSRKAVKGEPGAPITLLAVSDSSLAHADDKRDVRVIDVQSGQVVKSRAASDDDRAIFKLRAFGESTVVVYTKGYSTYTAVFQSD